MTQLQAFMWLFRLFPATFISLGLQQQREEEGLMWADWCAYCDKQ